MIWQWYDNLFSLPSLGSSTSLALISVGLRPITHSMPKCPDQRLQKNIGRCITTEHEQVATDPCQFLDSHKIIVQLPSMSGCRQYNLMSVWKSIMDCNGTSSWLSDTFWNSRVCLSAVNRMNTAKRCKDVQGVSYSLPFRRRQVDNSLHCGE